jgi:anti-sigma regulatory factor (Ser/Thr protein kinase)
MEITSGVLIPVNESSQVAEARRRGMTAASTLGFDETTKGRVALVVTEVATNLIKHARGGEVFIGPATDGAQRGVQVIAIDKGRGITNVGASLRDGCSTAGSSGTGLGAIQRASNTFDVYSGPNGGTVVAATVYPTGNRSPILGGVSVPAPKEDECGDGWAVWSAGQLTSVFLCDGLGHGAEAAHATKVAIDTFRRHAERAASEVVRFVFDALKSTRGAAVALAALDHREGQLTFCGLGNISGVIVSETESPRHLVSHNGIAGHTMRRLQEFTYPWPARSLLVLHSDGVGTSWSLNKYTGLSMRRPDVIAGVLYRDFRRGKDDATVVVARNGVAA